MMMKRIDATRKQRTDVRSDKGADSRSSTLESARGPLPTSRLPKKGPGPKKGARVSLTHVAFARYGYVVIVRPTPAPAIPLGAPPDDIVCLGPSWGAAVGLGGDPENSDRRVDLRSVVVVDVCGEKRERERKTGCGGR